MLEDVDGADISPWCLALDRKVRAKLERGATATSLPMNAAMAASVASAPIAMRRVTTFGEDDDGRASAGLLADCVELQLCSVRVVGSLNRQHGNANARQFRPDVPRAKRGIEPCVAPAEERGVGVVSVMTHQRGAQVARRRSLGARAAIAATVFVFAEDVRGLADHAEQAGPRAIARRESARSTPPSE